MPGAGTGLSQFETFIIAHWFSRIARIVQAVATRPNVPRAQDLRLASDLATEARRLPGALQKGVFADPDRVFADVSDAAREAVLHCETAAGGVANVGVLVDVTRAALALAKAIAAGSYDTELRALIRVVGIPRKGCGVRDLGIAVESPLAPWVPPRSAPAKTRTVVSATGGRKAVRTVRKTAKKVGGKKSVRKKAARKTTRRR